MLEGWECIRKEGNQYILVSITLIPIRVKWEKSTCVTLIAYILCNDQCILLIFGTKVKKTTAFCLTNGHCQTLLTSSAIWRQNFDNFILGHTVQ